MFRKRNIKNIYLLVVTSMLLTACFGSPTAVPEDRYYTLNISAPDIQPTKYERIVIDKVHAFGVYNERAMLYANAELPLQIKRYHYHHWTMSPAQLITHGLKDYLTQSKVAKSVVVSSFNQQQAVRVSVQLLAFERVISTSTQSVHVKLGFEIRYASGQYRTYSFEQTVPTEKNTMHSAAKAYGKALTEIFGQFLRKI